jgi:NAD(P)-dependent dehydrogenase (short-subunit alcohol dehydrogenase family)
VQVGRGAACWVPGMSSLRDRVVVVTGASAGVGRATVRALASQGAHIGLIARGPEGLEATEREVRSHGCQALALSADVARPEEVEAAAHEVEERLGPIDVWINNAMVTAYSPFVHLTAEEFRRITDVCYLGYVHGTMSALRRMVPRNRGVVVQVGSALAYRSIPLQSAYCGAKHAIVGFTDALRCELQHDRSKVHLTQVHLPAINTPQFDTARSRLPRRAQPVPPIFQPEVAADAIVWASIHHPRELKVGARTGLIIAGQKIAPGLADRYLARKGVEAQMTSEPDDPDRPDNLELPLSGDRGARGRFDDRARGRSPALQLAKHPWLALLGMAAVAGALSTLVAKGVRSAR